MSVDTFTSQVVAAEIQITYILAKKVRITTAKSAHISSTTDCPPGIIARENGSMHSSKDSKLLRGKKTRGPKRWRYRR